MALPADVPRPALRDRGRRRPARRRAGGAARGWAPAGSTSFPRPQRRSSCGCSAEATLAVSPGALWRELRHRAGRGAGERHADHRRRQCRLSHGSDRPGRRPARAGGRCAARWRSGSPSFWPTPQRTGRRSRSGAGRMRGSSTWRERVGDFEDFYRGRDRPSRPLEGARAEGRRRSQEVARHAAR